MHKRIRRLIAGVSLAATVATGAVVADQVLSPADDTTWGAPDTTDDTTWGTPPADLPIDLPPITPLDTTWG